MSEIEIGKGYIPEFEGLVEDQSVLQARIFSTWYGKKEKLVDEATFTSVAGKPSARELANVWAEKRIKELRGK